LAEFVHPIDLAHIKDADVLAQTRLGLPALTASRVKKDLQAGQGSGTEDWAEAVNAITSRA
jgi:hypothetical protein